MSITCPFLVTAPSATPKLVNRLLAYFRDWEFGEAPSWDRFQLITSRSEQLLEEKPTVPPVAVDEPFDNEWINATIEEVEAFANVQHSQYTDAERLKSLEFGEFCVLDEQSLKEKTIILFCRQIHYIDRPGTTPKVELASTFEKVRAPWTETYICWCNLNIANMGFDEFVEEYIPAQEDQRKSVDRFFPWKNLGGRDKKWKERQDTLRDKAEGFIKEMEKEGKA